LSRRAREKQRGKRKGKTGTGEEGEMSLYEMREGASDEGKNGTPCSLPSFFVFPPPFALFALFTFAGSLGSTLESVRADSFFSRPSPLPKNLCLGLAAFFDHRSFSSSLFLLVRQIAALFLRHVVDFQLKPEIRSNIRSWPVNS